MDLVSTIIKNTANVCRTINWTSKGALCVQPLQSVTVNYDVWSNASRIQQEYIISECQRGLVELTLSIIDANGVQHDMAFDPSIILRPVKVVKAEDLQNELATEVINSTETEAPTEEAPVAPVEEASVVEEVKLPEAEEEGPLEEEEEEVAVVVEEPVAEEPAKEEVLTRAEAEQQYTICVEAKDWEGAIKVLKAFARTEDLPLSDKTLMAIKDKSFANVVKRYDLGD
jgi:hypothetical protein